MAKEEITILSGEYVLILFVKILVNTGKKGRRFLKSILFIKKSLEITGMISIFFQLMVMFLWYEKTVKIFASLKSSFSIRFFSTFSAHQKLTIQSCTKAIFIFHIFVNKHIIFNQNQKKYKDWLYIWITFVCVLSFYDYYRKSLYSKKTKLRLEELVLRLVSFPEEKIDKELVKEEKKNFAKENKMSSVPTNMEVMGAYNKLVDEKKISPNKTLLNALKKRSIRSQSGIVPVQVLTKPWPCPGRCIFCPDDATMPKSYINTEPGAMRALLNEFDPIKQVYNRLLSLSVTWHDIDKIEMIILGGTWDSYPTKYKKWFIKSIFDACNTFYEFRQQSNIDYTNPKFSKFTVTNNLDIEYSKSLKQAQEVNEKASCRIIWLTVETRPEFVTDNNCRLWRNLGVTRLEIWLQSMFDEVLEANQRDHTADDNRKALHKLRQYWFKFSVHVMPWLYNSTVEKDIETFRLLYEDPWLKPDEIKFYPTSVIPNTRLNQYYQEWKYKPLDTKQIKYIIEKTHEEFIPPYTRVKRLIRDIPETEIIAGSKVTNLRQLVMNNLQKKYNNSKHLRKQHYQKLYPNMEFKNNISEFLAEDAEDDMYLRTYVIWSSPDFDSPRNFVSFCTRSREIRNKNQDTNNILLVIRKYPSSVWDEYFISYEDELWYLFGFARLLLPLDGNYVSYNWLWKNKALLRELHVYWQLASLNENVTKYFQHKWFGSSLLETAEKISKTKNYSWLSVISGIWVREYYRKLGYSKKGTYMVKKL